MTGLSVTGLAGRFLSAMRPSGSRPTLSVEVREFYVRQMRLLDTHDIDAHALTFTEDATFEHVPGPGVVVGRAAIAEALRRWDRGAGEPVQRRHWLSMIDPTPRGRGVIESTAYLLEIKIRSDAKPEIAHSSVVYDTLTRTGGRLLTRSRRVVED
ncbi:nuclear transport factor 2 family protein [Nocardia sp. NPDC049220]|uniref:nuclear transport factor 2 family protein n=1 Tax=Nocardia sp. NPDC049220 TaxID=3155273 RepID=UPI0033D2F83F